MFWRCSQERVILDQPIRGSNPLPVTPLPSQIRLKLDTSFGRRLTLLNMRKVTGSVEGHCDTESGCYSSTRNKTHSPGTPFKAWAPRSMNRMPDPATRSLTVLETHTSLGSAPAATRAAM